MASSLIILAFCLIIINIILMWAFYILRIMLWPFWPIIERSIARVRNSPSPFLEVGLIIIELIRNILVGLLVIVFVVLGLEFWKNINGRIEVKKAPAAEKVAECSDRTDKIVGDTYVLTSFSSFPIHI